MPVIGGVGRSCSGMSEMTALFARVPLRYERRWSAKRKEPVLESEGAIVPVSSE